MKNRFNLFFRLLCTTASRPVIFSGIQPTGVPHLGNYLGALINWNHGKIDQIISKEDKNAHGFVSLFSLVDLHAITVLQDPNILRENTLLSTAALLACGVDPKKSIVFIQSMVPEHCELSWILSTLTPFGWLKRMTQWKAKSHAIKGDSYGTDETTVSSSLGLFSYPVLMAADILLYRANYVPVGEDQLQHLELTRDIASAFHLRYGEYFPFPKQILSSSCRVMSLKDGRVKMSKSDSSAMSRIMLSDTDSDICHKIKRAKTDGYHYLSFDEMNRPEVTNMIQIYSAMSNMKIEDIEHKFRDRTLSFFKDSLAELLCEKLKPIRDSMEHLLCDKSYLFSIINEGSIRAREISTKTLSDVRSLVGLK